MQSKKRLVIIGGGAAGIFAAAICAEKTQNIEIIVLEKTRQLLSKVRISGGGRCNVTHAQFDPKKLVNHYPRGSKELLGPFHKFQPQDTIAWFNARGVELKTEEDGRMFPTSDHSSTIINALLEAAKEGGVDIRTEHGVRSIKKVEGRFHIELDERDAIDCDYVLLATGSTPLGHQIAASLGHSITPPVPSLFTFNTPTSPLNDLSGIAVEDVEISLEKSAYKQRGPVLITHWGFSGPAALKLSAWAARDLHACNYKTQLYINWIPGHDLKAGKPSSLPMNLWKRFLALCEIPAGQLSKKDLARLTEKLTRFPFTVEGKTTYKQEFVTSGGVSLKEIDFQTLESRLVDNLFFSGEVLDIDGVTGGFNFQNAWTTAYLAATCISTRTR